MKPLLTKLNFSLPIVEAVIREGMRLDTINPNNVAHKALRATKVGGYDLPEVINTWFDINYWYWLVISNVH